MNTATTLIRSVVMLLVLFLSTTVTKADVPGKPVEFGYKVVEGNTEGAMVKLSWMTNRDGGTPTSFEVYMAEGQTEDMSKFDKIATVEAEPNTIAYNYLTKRLEPGTYTFYIVAVNADGSSQRSIIKVVTIQKPDNKPAISIVSARTAEGSTEKAWEFKVKIEKKGEFKSVSFSLKEQPDGMTIDEETGVITWEHPTKGRHVFVVIVTGTLANGETVVTKQEFVLEVGGQAKPAIAIVSPRASEGTEGKGWSHQVKIEKKGEFKSISYAIDDAPEGVTINEETGKLSWDNPVAGRYVFSIIVKGTLENGETVTTVQEFVLEIGKKETRPCAEIVGTVKDANGEPAQGVVTVWMIKSANNTDKWMPFTKAYVQHGSYGVAVNAGTYKLRFESDTYIAEWYQDASELADAASIVVTCENPRNEVNFVVEKMPEPVFHTATGRVFDAEEGTGLENALVVFAPVKKDAANTPRGKEVRAETNNDGNYEVKLIEGVTYIATAIARPPAGTKNLYLQEWWENTNDATLAKGIVLTADQDAIDFPMDARENYDNGLSGKLVENETLVSVAGKVVAFQITARMNEPNKRMAESVTTDDQGNYEFTNLAPGKYLLYGIPDSRPWVPGWFVDGAAAAESWKKATVLEVGENTTMTDLKIQLRKIEKESGRGRISGHCYNSKGGIVVKSSGDVQAAIPVPGALVTATDVNGTIVDYAFADQDGVYSMETMPVGQFTVTADRVLFEPAANPVEILDQNLDVTTDFGMSPAVTSVDVPTDLVGGSINLYPNPANTSATLMFMATEGTAIVRVLDITGTVLSTWTVPVQGEQTSLQIATQNLATGMVMVQVSNGSTSFALPLQIVR